MIGEDSRTMEFLDVKLTDGQWHTFILHFHELKNPYNEMSLYVDCDVVGKPQTLAGRLGKTFNKKALNLAKMTVGQGGLVTSPKPLQVRLIYFPLSPSPFKGQIPIFTGNSNAIATI